MPKGLRVEGEEAGEVAALGLLRPPRLPCYLGRIAVQCTGRETVRPERSRISGEVEG